MLDLYDELISVVSALSDRGIDYALCGGLALAVYCEPRATVDIDLLVRPDDLEEAIGVVEPLGYTIEEPPMTFVHGAIEIRRISKPDPETGDALPLDLLLVSPEIVDVWDSRSQIQIERGALWVVSLLGLIAMKSLRANSQDMADIERLREGLEYG